MNVVCVDWVADIRRGSHNLTAERVTWPGVVLVSLQLLGAWRRVAAMSRDAS